MHCTGLIFLAALAGVFSAGPLSGNERADEEKGTRKMIEAEKDSEMSGASWVWYPEKSDPSLSAPPGTRYFRKVIEVPNAGKVSRATIAVTADNICKIFVNGIHCGSGNDWNKLFTIGFRRALEPGRNVVAIEAINEGDGPTPAGLIGKIRVEYRNRSKALAIPIDATWKASAADEPGWKEIGFNDSAWPEAVVIAPIGSLPWGTVARTSPTVPDDFPRFLIPGNEKEMETLRELFHLHYCYSRPVGTLWDGWLPMATLWPAIGSGSTRIHWRRGLLKRRIDQEGYVSTHQHKGLAHNEGWPFPLWTQAGGIGWQFSMAGMPYGAECNVHPTKSVEEWSLAGANSLSLDQDGWKLELTEEGATVTTPPFHVDAFVAPFIRIEWKVSGLGETASPFLEWTTAEKEGFAPDRRVYFQPPAQSAGVAYVMIPTRDAPGWNGTLTRLRLNLDNKPGAEVVFKSLITAVDSRHNINNATYTQGCCDYIDWTGDLTFLRGNINRMRRALQYGLKEFAIAENCCVTTPWAGHDGRSGLQIDPDGKKTVHLGRGIGDNYWDLLPFGGKDALATVYYYDAILKMADLEEEIDAHPEWRIPGGTESFDAGRLRRLAGRMKEAAGRLFWNTVTGRFVAAVDVDGRSWDYGLTIPNCELIYYGFTTESQAQSIVDWLSGKRIVESDTSRGEDIYHWRFAPRCSTLRNEEYYSFVWTAPESIPFGGQVQDGGGVLGFSFFDMMARLETNGPDDAWKRLREILEWFDEVQAEGGYRAYYKVPGRGTMQGGGTAGGLGMDREFLESVLLPQVMLYGFLGFDAGLDGFSIDPRLPSDWPSLTITNIHLHRLVLDITAGGKAIRVVSRGDAQIPLSVFPPAGEWKVSYFDADGKPIGEPSLKTLEKGDGVALCPAPGTVLELTRR